MSIERWDIDSARSEIQFAVRHLVFSKTRGRFTRWSGTVMSPDGDFRRATVEVVVDASSIDTGIERRDEHLRSADYLDVERYPTITFSASRVNVEPSSNLHVFGALTIRGVTRDITLAVVPNGLSLDSRENESVRFSARAIVDRRAFGFTGNLALDSGVVIGERIEVDINAEAVRSVAVRAA